jgi:hypothetical protein
MKFNQLVSACALVFALGCGSNDQTNNAQPAPAAKPAEMPKMLIVKVPVDAEGNEMDTLAQTREVTAALSVSDAESANSVFDSAKEVSVANELDSDSSTQQWGGNRARWWWNTPWYPGKVLGRGLWWGRNPYWNYGGFNYGYRCNNFYTQNNFNYYTYAPY